MRNQSSLVTWLAVIVVGLGIVAIVAMTVQSGPEPVALPTKIASTPTPTTIVPTATATPILSLPRTVSRGEAGWLGAVSASTSSGMV